MYSFIKTSQNVPTQGVFETFTVSRLGIDLFYWSDNNGLSSMIHDISAYPAEIQAVYNEMLLADAEANRLFRLTEDIEDESGRSIYARDGRCNEFGVEWQSK